MLINFTNHPSDKWGNIQKEAAVTTYGSILDYTFPNVSPEATGEDIDQMARHYFNLITAAFDSCANEPYPHVVHIQGEFTLVHRLVNLLTASKITCVASTTRRIVTESADGTRTYKFEFVKFRKYI